MSSPGLLESERHGERDDSARAERSGAAQCLAPSCEHPCWHRPDGDRVSFQKVLSELAGEAGAEELRRKHAEAIAGLVVTALEEQRAGQSTRARTHALAASRLCQEIVGFWPCDLPDLH